MPQIIEKAYAKLNLALLFDNVSKELEDGRKLHIVSSPVVTLDFYNIFKFTKSETDNPETDNIEVVINTDNKWILQNMKKLTGPEGNCWKTVEFLQNETGKKLPIRMEIEYNLPLSGGLGGSAADMAAILRGLNRFYNLGYSIDDLAKLGYKLGSDVPFCVYNYPYAHIGGTGEIIKKIESNALDGYQVILAFPQITIPLSKTKSAFKAYDNCPSILPNESIKEGFSNFELMLKSGRFEPKFLCNCFLLKDIPWRNEVLAVMNSLNNSNIPFKFVGMAGAGPTVFAVCKSIELGNLPKKVMFEGKEIPLTYTITTILRK